MYLTMISDQFLLASVFSRYCIIPISGLFQIVSYVTDFVRTTNFVDDYYTLVSFEYFFINLFTKNCSYSSSNEKNIFNKIKSYSDENKKTCTIPH